tara:strand:- start:1466 stop:2764 length:1299 start_codon:yes stop_codon:yes gene_type:complete
MTESNPQSQDTAKSSRKKIKPFLDHLQFGQIQQELIMITEEIRKQHELSVVDRLKDLIFQEEDEDPRFQEHVDGSSLSKKLGTRESNQLSSDLRSNPASLPKRVELVRLILNSKPALNMKDYRNLLLQSCLPIYIGHITPYHLQLCGQVFRLYLKKVIQFSKKKMLTVRSKQLGGLNVNRISMHDLLKSVQEGEESEDSQLISEIKYAHYLLDHSKDLIKLMRSRITIPVDLCELNEHIPEVAEQRKFLGNILSGRVIPDKKAMLSRKVVAVLDVMKEIYPLHAISLRITQRMQEIEDKMPQAFMMEGRIRMEALKLSILKMRSGDVSSRTGLRPSFSQILDTYRKALKRASVRNPQPQDIPVLSEFVQMTLFAQTHRILLEIDLGRMRQLLEASQKACHALVRADGHYRLLQERLNNILRRYGLLKQASVY